ncbi:MAG TPA: pyridoxamine 5'-phosphate oxidase family protein [Vicinamibacterales bacterium]|nr:pyridoxamine 5'-phosphate oxidase family protein [Vicinamibacterales bacterium]
MALDEKDILHGDAAREKLRQLLKDFPIAFMVTVHDGALTARPIGVVGDHAAFDGTLWFITDKRSRKVDAIDAGASTALLFQNDGNGAYLHLSGRAAVVEDRPRLEELYTTLQRTWFPKGLDDPDITLLRFDVEEGNYWDSHNSMVRLAFAFAKSLITGAPGKSGNAGIAKLD